jgi:hypothetical protein
MPICAVSSRLRSYGAAAHPSVSLGVSTAFKPRGSI